MPDATAEPGDAPMTPWTPDLASVDLEQKMEAENVPEDDRDELRRFEEVLRRRKAKHEGAELPPAPDGMREWLLGADTAPDAK